MSSNEWISLGEGDLEFCVGLVVDRVDSLRGGKVIIIEQSDKKSIKYGIKPEVELYDSFRYESICKDMEKLFVEGGTIIVIGVTSTIVNLMGITVRNESLNYPPRFFAKNINDTYIKRSSSIQEMLKELKKYNSEYISVFNKFIYGI